MSRRASDKDESGTGAKMYLGPTFFGIVQKGTVFSGGLPPKVAALVKGHPFLGGLMVPVDQLTEARKELKKAGSQMEMIYRRAVELGGVRNV